MDPIDVRKLEKFQPEFREDVKEAIVPPRKVVKVEPARFYVYLGTRQLIPCLTLKEALKHSKWNMHAVVEIFEDCQKVVTIRRP